MTVRVIGVGSPAGDDEAGWLVIDALRARGAETTGAVLVKADRPGAALLAQWTDADHVILVDAMQTGSTPGSIRHLAHDAWRTHDQGLSTHGFGVLDALTLADALGALPPRLDVFGVEIADVAPGATLSAAVRGGVEALASAILGVLRATASWP